MFFFPLFQEMLITTPDFNKIIRIPDLFNFTSTEMTASRGREETLHFLVAERPESTRVGTLIMATLL
jgi:hypothetical protein